jgi:hypothetical protein
MNKDIVKQALKGWQDVDTPVRASVDALLVQDAILRPDRVDAVLEGMDRLQEKVEWLRKARQAG